jgi:hypothetical protein
MDKIGPLVEVVLFQGYNPAFRFLVCILGGVSFGVSVDDRAITEKPQGNVI